MTKIPENQHEARIERENNLLSDAALLRTLQGELDKGQHPYSQQWRAWFISATIFGFVGGVLSFITESFALGYLLHFQQLPPALAMAIAVAVGCGLAFLIEYMKRGANDRFFFNLVFRRKFSGYNFLKVLFIMAISISASFYACVLLPSAVPSAPVPLISTDSIKSEYAPRIATLTASVESLRTNAKSWNGGVKSVTDNQKELDRLYAAQDTALNQAYIENTRRQTAAIATAQGWGYIIGYFSIGLELLFILSFWYTKKYLYNSALERGLLAGSNDDRLDDEYNTDLLEKHIDDADPHKAPEARTIVKGFINDDRPNDDRLNDDRLNDDRRKKQCKHCGESFTYKHWNKQFCSDECRVKAWELAHNKKFTPKKKEA